MVKWLPEQCLQAVSPSDCSLMCSLHLFSVFFYLHPSSSSYFECYPGNCCVRSSPPGEYLLWLWEFLNCLNPSIGRHREQKNVPSKPWQGGDEYVIMPGFLVAAAPSSPTFFPVWFLPGSPLSAFNPDTDSFFPFAACITPPFLQQEVSEAIPDRWEKSLVSELPLLFSPGRAGCPATWHMQTCLSFISPRIRLAGAFQKGVVMNMLYITKIKGKSILKESSFFPLIFFFFE